MLLFKQLGAAGCGMQTWTFVFGADRAGGLTCCPRDVAVLCPASSWASLPSAGSGSGSVAFARSPRTASTISRCLHRSSSSSRTPASVALRRSPMRTRSVPDQSELTQPRRTAAIVALAAGRLASKGRRMLRRRSSNWRRHSGEGSQHSQRSINVH